MAAAMVISSRQKPTHRQMSASETRIRGLPRAMFEADPLMRGFRIKTALTTFSPSILSVAFSSRQLRIRIIARAKDKEMAYSSSRCHLLGVRRTLKGEDETSGAGKRGVVPCQIRCFSTFTSSCSGLSPRQSMPVGRSYAELSQLRRRLLLVLPLPPAKSCAYSGAQPD